jgi:hypothetical protein
MAQIDIPSPASASPPPADGGPGRAVMPYQGRTFALWLVGLIALLAVLIVLREFQIFPRGAGDDAEIVAARATQGALLTQEAASANRVAVATAPPTSVTAPTAGTLGAAVTPGQQPTSAAIAGQPTVTKPTAATAPTVQPAPTPIQAALPPDLAAAILEGYSNYWSVRVVSIRNPDPENEELEAVMTDTELARAREVLAGYQREGKEYEADVKHQIWITQATATEALVVDQYMATSVRLDPASGRPISSDNSPNIESLRTTFLLRNDGGRWKVSDQREGG